MRIGAAAMGVGIAQGAFDLVLTYSKQGIEFSKKIASFEAIRNKLADMATRRLKWPNFLFTKQLGISIET